MATFYYISNGLSIYSLELCGWGDTYPPPRINFRPECFLASIVFSRLGCLNSFSFLRSLLLFVLIFWSINACLHRNCYFRSWQHTQKVSFYKQTTFKTNIFLTWTLWSDNEFGSCYKNVKLQLGNILNTNVTFHVQSEMVRSWEGSLAQAAMKRPVSRVLPIMSC